MNPSAHSGPTRSPDARPGAEASRRQPRATLALCTDDLSAFSRHLREQLLAHLAAGVEPAVPTHVQLLNMLARAAGYRNLQALKAEAASARTEAHRRRTMPATVMPAGEAVGDAATALDASATRALGHFDAQGRLVRWPTKQQVQVLAMWGLWMRFDGARRYTEREVNDILNAWNTAGDHATLRRELINWKLLGRESDCSVYWKERRQPEEAVRAFLQALRTRRASVAEAV